MLPRPLSYSSDLRGRAVQRIIEWRAGEQLHDNWEVAFRLAVMSSG